MRLSGAAVPEAVVHVLQGCCRFAEFSGLRPSNRSASVSAVPSRSAGSRSFPACTRASAGREPTLGPGAC